MLQTIKRFFDSRNNGESTASRKSLKERGLRMELCEDRVLLTASPLQADLPSINETAYTALDFNAESTVLEAVVVNMDSVNMAAAEQDTPVAQPMNAETTVTTAADLQNAINGATGATTIKLTANITMDSFINIGKDITLDLNGKTLSSSSDRVIQLVQSKLTIVDSSTAGGKITSTYSGDGNSMVIVAFGATVDIQAGTISASTSQTAGQAQAIYATAYNSSVVNVTVKEGVTVQASNSSNNVSSYGIVIVGNSDEATTSTLNVNGTVKANNIAISGNGSAGLGGTSITVGSEANISSTTGIGIYHPQAGVLNVNGGTITGVESGIAIKSGTLNVSGGTITCTGAATTPTGYSNGANASGSAIQIESNNSYAGDIKVNITGGTIKSTNNYAVQEYTANDQTSTTVNSLVVNASSATLTSATGKSAMALSDPTDTTPGAADKLVVTSGEVSVTKGNASTPATTTVEAKKFTIRKSSAGYVFRDGTLADALTAADDGDTIILGENVTLEAVVTIPDGKAITIDLNGHNITNATGRAFNVNGGSLTLDGTGTVSGGYAGIYVYANSGLTVGAGATVVGPYGIVVSPGSGTTCDNTNITINGKISAPDASVDSGTIGIFVHGNITESAKPATITVNNGAVITGKTGTSSDRNLADAQAIAMNGYAKVVINGGKLTGDEAIGVKSGELAINGGTFNATGSYVNPETANNNGTEITGAAISVTSTYSTNGQIKVDIENGNINSKNGYALFVGGNDFTNKPGIEVTGGTFTTTATDTRVTSPVSVSSEAVYTETSDEAYVVSGQSATYYPTLADAISAAGATTDATIVLTSNVTVTADTEIPANVTLNTNGYTITAANNVTVTVKGAITAASPVQLVTSDTGKFVFESGDSSKLNIGANEYIGSAGAVVVDSGTLTVNTNNGGFNAVASEVLTIAKGNGEMFGTGLAAGTFYMGQNDTLNVTAGTLNVNVPMVCTGTITPADSPKITLGGGASLTYKDNTTLVGKFTNGEVTMVANANGSYSYYPTFQAALDNANGGTIKLTAALDLRTKYGSLILNSDVTIDGLKEGTLAEGESPYHTITGNGTDPIFDINKNGLTIGFQNLTLINGNSHDVGGGIRNTTNSSLTLASVTMTNCKSNMAGGAIYSEGDVTITGTSTFSGNESARGAAIYVTDGKALSITGGTAATASYTDGAVKYLKQYSIVFTNNISKNDGAVYTTGETTINGVSFVDNPGTAVYIAGTTATNTFTSTDFIANKGTAVYANGGTVNLNGAVVFAGNAGYKGGAIYLAGGTLESGTPVETTANELVQGGVKSQAGTYAAQFFGNEGTYGGAINASGTANLSDMYFERNQAVYGGAVYGSTITTNANTTMTMNYASFHGGAIYNTGTSFAATGATITNNWAGVNYGAVYGVTGVTGNNFVVNAGHAKGIVNTSAPSYSGLMAMPAGGEGTDEDDMYQVFKYSKLADGTVTDAQISDANKANAKRAFEYLKGITGTTGLTTASVTEGHMSTVYLSSAYEQYVSPEGYDNLSTSTEEDDYNWLRVKSDWEFKSQSSGTTPIVLTKTADPQAAACDFDDSGKVDMVDFVDFAQSFNSTDSAKDFDGNGKVDMADFIHFAQQFNKQVLDLAQEDALAMKAAAAAELPEVPTAQPVVVVEAAPVVEAIPAALPEAAPVVIDAPKAAAAKPAENFWDSYDALGDSIETPVVTPVSEDGSYFDEEPIELFESADAEALDTEL